MTVKTAKRKASIAVKDIITAARRYVEAEQALQEAIRAEQPARNEDHNQGAVERLREELETSNRTGQRRRGSE